MVSDLKYLFAYIVPLLVAVSLWLGGWGSYLTVGVLFGFIPLLELLLPQQKENDPPALEEAKRVNRFYDVLLYLNVPIQLGLMGWYLWLMQENSYAPYEWVGMALAMGMGCGIMGINVAHELGHRSKKYEQWMAQTLLLTTLYMHFFVEHNRGHHKYVSTPLDPATARRGEPVYVFWVRSIVMSFVSAWKLEQKRMELAGKPVWNADNLMVRFTVLQVAVCVLIGTFIGLKALAAFLAASLIGILLLETVNYIEHYGLLRREIRPGVYERVLPCHSWNSDHALGRILLYELTRHSDHHYLASRKYQTLRRHEESPCLPTGYPGMMLLSLIPPLWFRIMDPNLPQTENPSFSHNPSPSL
jgi:alkane 1-monooxygenase